MSDRPDYFLLRDSSRVKGRPVWYNGGHNQPGDSLKSVVRTILALLFLAGVTACGGSDPGGAPPLAPPRLLLLVERAEGGSDAALEAGLSPLANDTAARGWRHTPPAH